MSLRVGEVESEDLRFVDFIKGFEIYFVDGWCYEKF